MPSPVSPMCVEVGRRMSSPDSDAFSVVRANGSEIAETASQRAAAVTRSDQPTEPCVPDSAMSLADHEGCVRHRKTRVGPPCSQGFLQRTYGRANVNGPAGR